MKKIAAIIAVLALYPAISRAADEAAATQGSATSQETMAPNEAAAAQKIAVTAQNAVGRIYVINGNVTVGERPVKTGGPIASGMLVKTGENSAALLKFDDGQVVAMQSGTSFEVREYRYDAGQIENSKIDLAFSEGGVLLATGLIGQKNRLAFSLLTPNATIRGDVAKFAVVKADKLIYAKVLDGNVRITNSAGTASFKAGESPVVPSSLIRASEFYTSAPRGIFNELLSIPVVPPVIVEPEPAPKPAPPSAPEPASLLELASGSGLSPGSAAAPSPVPGPVPEPVPEPAPVPEPLPASAPEPAPVSETALIPAQAVPSCTCTCTYSCK